MNLFKWLKDKVGKMPVSIAQAAGLTAVVGAAGFAAMSYLNAPTDNNTAFIPPSAYEQQGDVVYISQNGGGGQYEANGEVGSTFRAAPSKSIQLANQQAARERQARELEEADVQPAYAGQDEGGEVQLPKAYQLSGGDLGLGMGGNADKQLNGSLDMFSSLQNQLSGMGDAINQAQAAGQNGTTRAAGAAGAADKAAGTSGQTAAQLANASHNWGQGGLTHAGSGNSSSNAFALQDSGKNAGGKDAAAAMAQAGNVMADARAAMANLQKEGSRMRSRANFGRSDGLGEDRDARGQGARQRYGNAKSELEWIRKQSAAIAKNNTNAANAGGAPFLASAKISGGLMVDGENVTTGQGASSGDLSTADNQLKGIGAKMNTVSDDMDEREMVRDNLKQFLLAEFMVAVSAMFGISILVRLAKHSGPWSGFFWAAAGVLTALTLWYIWHGTIKYVTKYNGTCGSDGWTILGWGLATLLTAGVGVSWYWSAAKATEITKATLSQALLPIIGFGGVGFGLSDILKKK